ncbi:MAG: PilZ domain-containing protein [Pirellulales bacterium]|nr:PilZ domain-containing protein [Pirellulales bacterium]
MNLDLKSIPDPPEALIQFVQRLREQANPEDERRQSVRYPLTAVVTILPIEWFSDQRHEPFKAVSKDISTSGLSVIGTRPVTTQQFMAYIEVDEQPAVALLVNTVRCRAVGHLYEIAGQITKKLDQ